MKVINNEEILNTIRAAGGKMTTAELAEIYIDVTASYEVWNARARLNGKCNRLRKQGYLLHPDPFTWIAIR